MSVKWQLQRIWHGIWVDMNPVTDFERHHSTTSRKVQAQEHPKVYIINIISFCYNQFADGVILLLLIGELEGFFIPLYEFYLSPATHSEMVNILDSLFGL